MPEPAAEETPFPISAPLPHQTTPRIPDHELTRCVGRGSYGEIWLARNVIGTYRAVKVVYRSTFENDHPYEREFNGIKRFEPVSRSHDGFVDILQVGREEEAGYFYYVMELADDCTTGQDIHPKQYLPKTLGSELGQRQRLPFAECLQVGLSLSSALGHLHSHGLIHRDVKPANIIFVGGLPKLADIGLVTELDANTMPGGTLGYMPPEGTLSPQGDIFALGKVLYEISTGLDRQKFPEWPTFDGDGEAEKRFSEINEVVIRACAHDPRERYQTAAELHDDLLLLQSGKSVKRLRVLERRWKTLTRIALVLAGAILLSGTGTYLAYRAKNAATRRLADSYIAYGTHSIDEGDSFGSLPWFAEALRLDQGDAEREDRDRIHLAVTLRQCPKTVRLWFYTKETDYARFSPDGRRVIVGGSDGTAAVWEVTNDTPVLKLAGHSKEVMSVAYSQDGRFMLTASQDRTACVWGATNGQRLATLVHPAALYHAQFSPDGTRVVTGSTDSKARVWDWAAGRELLVYTQHIGAIRSVAFSPDGRRIVTASHDETARIWDASTGESLGKAFRHGNWIYQAAFSPDGRFVVTASFDQTAALWEAETGRQIRVWPHQAAVRGAEFSPDGRLVVTTSWDLTTRLWNVATGQAVGPPLKHDSQALSISFSPDGRRLLAASTHGIVTVWDLAPIRWLPPRFDAFFSADGSHFSTVNGNTVQLQKAASAASIKIESMHPVSEVKINRNGSRLLTLSPSLSSPSGTVVYAQLWDGMRGQALAPAFACDSRSARATMSESGLRLATATGAVVQVWDTVAGQRLAQLRADGRIQQFSFDPSGTLLVLCQGKRAEIWNATNAVRLLVLGHACDVSWAEFSPDGRRLVTAASEDSLTEREAQVWDVRTGQKLGPALQHRDGVLYATFSLDGKHVLTASEDNSAQVWDPIAGKRLLAPFSHKFQVYHATYSPDGRWIATASRDKTSRVWDAVSGVPITPPLRHDRSVWYVQFFDGRHNLVTRTSNGENRLWNLLPDSRSVEDLARLSRLASRHEIDPTGAAFPLGRDALEALWNALRSRYPKDFEVSEDDVLMWHQREAEASESEGQWQAGLFHWERLMEIHPGEPSFQQRRERARAATKSDAAPRP